MDHGKKIFVPTPPVSIPPGSDRLVDGTPCQNATSTGTRTTMQYLLLIYQNEADMSQPRNGEVTQMHADYRAFTQAIIQAGQFKAGDALQSTSTATTVRVRDGKTLTTDGPFAETREQLGGYYLIEAKDLDEATAIAAKVPSAQIGSVEVRPVWAMG
jgi:hypothetical protein